MRVTMLSLAVLLAACSGATGPQGLDPTVLLTNISPADTLYFTWRDGQGITGSVTVLPSGSSCTRFTAQADSAYFEAHATNNVFHTTATYTQPWFDPATRPAWTMQLSDAAGAAQIQVIDVSPTEPC
jgi:hypothetical protein